MSQDNACQHRIIVALCLESIEGILKLIRPQIWFNTALLTGIAIAGAHSLNMGSLRKELHMPPQYTPQDDEDDDWGMEDDVMMLGSTPKVRNFPGH